MHDCHIALPVLSGWEIALLSVAGVFVVAVLLFLGAAAVVARGDR